MANGKDRTTKVCGEAEMSAERGNTLDVRPPPTDRQRLRKAPLVHMHAGVLADLRIANQQANARCPTSRTQLCSRTTISKQVRGTVSSALRTVGPQNDDELNVHSRHRREQGTEAMQDERFHTRLPGVDPRHSLDQLFAHGLRDSRRDPDPRRLYPRLYWNDHCIPGSEWIKFTHRVIHPERPWIAREQEETWSPWVQKRLAQTPPWLSPSMCYLRPRAGWDRSGWLRALYIARQCPFASARTTS